MQGGAIANLGTLSLTNSTLSGNSAAAGNGGPTDTGVNGDSAGGSAWGGALYSAGGLDVTNDTASANSTAGGAGGTGGGTVGRAGVARGGDLFAQSGAPRLANTILARGTPDQCAFTPGVALSDQGGNLEEVSGQAAGTCGLSSAKNDAFGSPNLGPLAPNGGPTATMALLPGSRALNLGLASVCQTVVGPNGVGDTDQRGQPRHADSRGVCDSGSFDTGGAAPTAGWVAQSSGTTQRLHAVSCPTRTTCIAVGDSGTILATTDGGSTWHAQSSHTTQWLFGVVCTSSSACLAVGGNGTILATGDGGLTWQNRPSGTANSLWALSCPTASQCVAVGDGGTILRSTDGGASWHVQPSGTTSSLRAVSCPAVQACFAAGALGVLLASVDGGVSWHAQASGTSQYLYGLSCVSATTCVAVRGGDNVDSPVLATSNGGTSWVVRNAHTTNWFWGVACLGSGSCTAVGGNEWIAASADGGSTWSTQHSGSATILRGVGCAPDGSACVAVGDGGTILRRSG